MTTTKNNLFEPKLVNNLISKVKGYSTLTKLSKQIPIAFNGNKEFVFSMDKEIDIVAEGGKKTEGGLSLATRVIVPIKVEYGARITDEFLYASEEEKLNILSAFTDGYAKKLAKGIDLMGIHGINPRTGQVSNIINNNDIAHKVTQKTTFNEKDPDTNMEEAIQLVIAAEGDVTGLAMDPSFSSCLAKQKNNNDAGDRLFPELRWGAKPSSINGIAVDIHSTVGNGSKIKAIVGDFENGFKWGYAKQIPFEIIKYGDPDNSGQDLKGHNQIYLRSETYLGWSILEPNHFAIVEKTEG